jgi:hypothetical protein
MPAHQKTRKANPAGNLPAAEPDPDAWKKYSFAEYSLLVQYLGFTPYFCVMADSLMSFTSNSIVAAPFLPEQNFCSKQTATPFWTL